jgi:hypothetical protein
MRIRIVLRIRNKKIVSLQIKNRFNSNNRIYFNNNKNKIKIILVEIIIVWFIVIPK